MRVLVVEDHAETRGMIEAVLREAGYATVAAGGLEAMQPVTVSKSRERTTAVTMDMGPL